MCYHQVISSSTFLPNIELLAGVLPSSLNTWEQASPLGTEGAGGKKAERRGNNSPVVSGKENKKSIRSLEGAPRGWQYWCLEKVGEDRRVTEAIYFIDIF